MAGRPWLRRLADRVGILPDFVGWRGSVHTVSDTTREALLRALGHDASSEHAAFGSLQAMQRAAAAEPIDPVRVVTAGSERSGQIAIRVPDSWSGRVDWSMTLHTESGVHRELQGAAHVDAATSSVDVALQPVPDPGYHELGVVVSNGPDNIQGHQTLIVAPSRCVTPGEVLGRSGKAFGICCNLYTLRSASNWGVGNFGDLRELTDWAAGLGAGFVGLNPLHVLANEGANVCPYQPLSRLFRNALYLDITAIPEWRECPAAQELLGSADVQARLAALRHADRVDYGRVATLYRAALERLHETFVRRHAEGDTDRGRAYRKFVREQPQLEQFATFMALDEQFRIRGVSGGWRDWPRTYRQPGTPEVQRFAAENSRDIALHRYVQFELDLQLAGSAAHARSAGMPVGLYQDLALGTAPGGFDSWIEADLFVHQASAGAPPDPFAEGGQNWGLAPVHPHRLRAGGYGYWIRLLRHSLAHTGALRVDHVMGLARQYWIPEGASATNGAYVRFPAADLFAILSLESRRHGALIVGEDLGTVEPAFREELARRGVLSSQVLYFQRDQGGGFLPGESYAEMAMATANTHDLVPLAGFWGGEDIALRRQLGQYANAQQLAEARDKRRLERVALTQRLQAEGHLRAEGEPTRMDLSAAVHGFLRSTPARLVGLSLDDLAGETRPVNVPGVRADRWPNWCRRMRRDLAELLSDPQVRRGAVQQRAAVPASSERDLIDG